MAITPADVYRHTKVPVPLRERTLKVYVRSTDIQPGVFEGYADHVAGVCVTAAMCHGVTRIELHFPNRQAVLMDCDDIKKMFASESGHWASPGSVPPQASIYNLYRLGAHFESWRPQVTIPAALESTTNPNDTVSGDEPAVKED